MTYRTSNFKLEQIHGRVPSKSSYEAELRNFIFGTRILRINHSENNKIDIRIIGYEVPIYSRGKRRDECIDLLGYDKQYRPWIIELKQGKATDSLNDVVAQVNRYAEAFDSGIRQAVQKELRDRLLWPEFLFNGKAKRMILAHRIVFSSWNDDSDSFANVYFCSFSRVKDESTLMKAPRDSISLKIERLTTE